MIAFGFVELRVIGSEPAGKGLIGKGDVVDKVGVVVDGEVFNGLFLGNVVCLCYGLGVVFGVRLVVKWDIFFLHEIMDRLVQISFLLSYCL